jgi:prephenate dehydrogenase
MDTLSVKSSIVREIRRMAGRVEGLSINPMFAPVMGWTGNGVAVVEVFVGPKSTFFKNLLSTWGARLEPVDAEEHDRLTAAIQVATHAAVIAFGGALLGLNFDLERAMRLSTPPHRLMLTLLHRMTTQSVDVYWDIQTYHPLGIAVRKEMIDTLERLDEDAAKCEARRFAEIFAALNALFQPRDALFKRWAGHAFAAVDFGNDENPAGTSNLR